jgi:hypothetical protein
MPAPLFSVTEMLTTAGSTRFTKGAKLCAGCTAADAAGLSAAGELSAQIIGGSASPAPRVTPSAAARIFFSERRRDSAGSCVIALSFWQRFAIKMASRRNSRLAGGLIRRNLYVAAISKEHQ